MKRQLFFLVIAGAMAMVTAFADNKQQSAEYVYQSLGKRDPFQPPAEVKEQLAAIHSDVAAPTEQRRKEPLEAFQLDSLKLVATLLPSTSGTSAAMFQDPMGKGYLVRTGSYIGTREGQIMAIADGVVTIKEPPHSKTADPKMIILRLHEEKAQ